MLVFTSCVNNYLPKARVLAESVKKFHPGWEFCLLLGEEPPRGVMTTPFDRILQFSELGVPNFHSWYFQHRLVEICTAIKGQALNYFLETEKKRKVIYLDPDIMVLAPLSPLEQLLEENDILLTPHQLAPQDSARAIVDNEISSLRHGIFNLGFIGCACRGDGIAFSRFWRDRLKVWCLDDKENGLFTDQKWCDLAPAYFHSLKIVRDPGCNAASWNLTDREITQGPDGSFLANGQTLRFYHFTGHDSGMGEIMSQAYGAHMPAVAELWRIYKEKLANAGQEELGNHPWSGATFSNGMPVTDEARLYYRQNPVIQALFPEPLLTDASGRDGFAGYWIEISRKEKNRLYVWARKPFRLAKLTHLYLQRNGGLKAIPGLIARSRDIWRQEGVKGFVAKIRKFRQNMGVGIPVLTLAQLLKPPSQWAARLAGAFDGYNGILVLDHQYGGGANDYRDMRIKKFLAAGQPVLLLTWDFFGHKLKCAFYLPDGSTISADAGDLEELSRQDAIHFNRILVNELVLWSGADQKKNHYAALPHLLARIIELKARDNAYLEVDINDFYMICPSYNLLEGGGSFCGVSDDPERCRKCLVKSPFNVPPDFNPAAWRKSWGDFLVRADEIRAFSNSTAQVVSKAFNLPENSVNVVLHEPLAPLAPVPEAPPDAPMRIGVIGNIVRHKGSEIVKELAGLLEPNESIVVVGKIDGNGLPDNVGITGFYQRENLPEIIMRENITVILIPSIWPETFCYTAQETMQMDLPLVTFPLGAQAERVRKYAKGVVAPEVSAQSALACLRSLDERRRNRSANAADSARSV